MQPLRHWALEVFLYMIWKWKKRRTGITFIRYEFTFSKD